MHADSRNEAPAAHRRGRAGVMLRDRLRLDRLEPFARFAQEPACVAVDSRPPFDKAPRLLMPQSRSGRTRPIRLLSASVLLLTGIVAAVVVTVRLNRSDARQQLGQDDARPNVVIVSLDTLRADHTSVHGYDRDTKPNLRRIGEQGLVLRSHFANAPWTKPSVASLITGLHPSAHGSRVGQFETLQGIERLRLLGYVR